MSAFKYYVIPLASGAATNTKTASLDGALAKTSIQTANLGALLSKAGVTKTGSLDGVLAAPPNYTTYTRTASLNALLFRTGLLKTGSVDAVLIQAPAATPERYVFVSPEMRIARV